MIDRKNRNILSRQLRLLATGKITNDTFEDAIDYSSDDNAIWYIFRKGAWPLYDNLHEHKLNGKYKLQKEEKRNIAKCILFLKSNREYQWKEPQWLIQIILVILGISTLGHLSRFLYIKYMSRQGDFDVWPYLLNSDFEADNTLHWDNKINS